MKVGLMGFGRAGRAVAAILLECKETNLQWVLRRSTLLEHRSVPEFLGVTSDEPGLIYSKDEFTPAQLLDRHPVDVVVDFSSPTGLDYYADEAAKRKITIVSAVSLYSPEQLELLDRLAETTTVMHSPNITIGINFLIIAAQILKKIAPYTDIEIVEEHFKQKSEVSGRLVWSPAPSICRRRASRVSGPGASSGCTRSSSVSRTRPFASGMSPSREKHSATASSSPSGIWKGSPRGSIRWKTCSCPISCRPKRTSSCRRSSAGHGGNAGPPAEEYPRRTVIRTAATNEKCSRPPSARKLESGASAPHRPMDASGSRDGQVPVFTVPQTSKASTVRYSPSPLLALRTISTMWSPSGRVPVDHTPTW